MDKRVYFLMIISFVIGMVELIISGILDLIANDLQVSLADVGSLITVFAFIFAVFGPILLILTAKIERRKLFLTFLYVFLIGCFITIFSPNFTILYIGRIVLAISGALLIILCLVIAPNLVDKKYQGRAIGIVSMGVSASLVLGVPIGLILGSTFSWRAPFILISILTILSIIGVHLFMGELSAGTSVPLKTQLASLKNLKISLALITTFLYMSGHTILYAYFKPYLQTVTSFNELWISVIYFIFGVAAVSGGGLGGILADIFGSRKTILLSLVLFSGLFFVFPLFSSNVVGFLLFLSLWGILSWAISPPMQSYLIESAPKSAAIQQSLNNSALHLGIAFGSIVGGIVIDHLSVQQNPFIGGIFISFSFITAIISIRLPGISYLRESVIKN